MAPPTEEGTLPWWGRALSWAGLILFIWAAASIFDAIGCGGFGHSDADMPPFERPAAPTAQE